MAVSDMCGTDHIAGKGQAHVMCVRSQKAAAALQADPANICMIS